MRILNVGRWRLELFIEAQYLHLSQSPAMHDVFKKIDRVVNTQASVLMIGESGTGKEAMARYIHDRCHEKSTPFVAINCSALPDNLLEAELFEHTKGAFTGAHQARKGLFQEAHQGTLFLDEIGDMSLAFQAKLLRVLQDGKVRPVGENLSRNVSVRIIAATHRKLKDAIVQGSFRADLYYRIQVVEVELSPLRERKEDILQLAAFFIKKSSLNYKKDLKVLSHEAQSFLVNFQWPGNIRQLENAISRAFIMCEGPILHAEEFEFLEVKKLHDSTKKNAFLFTDVQNLPSLNEFSIQYIQYVLDCTGNKKEKVALILKIDRTTLHRKMVEFTKEMLVAHERQLSFPACKV
jgi:transcriptional regulator with PAS, ATPase and Fis domain